MKCLGHYFHVYEGEQMIEEDQRPDLPDIAAAQDEHARIIRATLAEEEWKRKLPGGRELRVFGEYGQFILSVPFSEAPEGRDGSPSESALCDCQGS
jgi:hypothetical protein